MAPHQLKDTPLYELKRIALEELGLTKDKVREYGKLTYRATWENAIADIRAVQLWERDGVKQPTRIHEQPPDPEEKQENCTINLATYEVIQSSPESHLHTFSAARKAFKSSTESLGKAHPKPSRVGEKLPFEDFFRRLFSLPKASPIVQLA